jgi:hypothetical protein
VAVCLATPGSAQEKPDVSFEKCVCSRTKEKTIQCNIACMQPASPEIVAALRKRYPALEESDILVFDTFIDGNHTYDVAFYTSKWHMSCRLRLNPIKFSNCRIVHG